MTTQGTITGVNGNMITVRFEGAVALNEVGYAKIEGVTLMCEIVRIRGRLADMQVFEDTSDLAVGNLVEYTGELLSVELGPGLLTQIYDGLQNPLPKLAEACGFFLQRGKYIEALPRDTPWAFTPTAKPGDILLLAGKGHETYQIVGDVKNHFDDKEEALRAFALYAKN